MVLATVLALMVASCAPSAPTPTTGAVQPPKFVEPDVIKIGINVEATGPAAAVGNMLTSGVTLAYELRPTVLGKPVELVVYDNKGDKNEAYNAAVRLMEQDKVTGVVGPVYSTLCLATGEAGEKYHVPSIGPSTTNPLTTVDRKYFFRACFMNTDQGWNAVRYAVDSMGAKTAALFMDIGEDSAVDGCTRFARLFITKTGDPKSIVATVTYTAGDRDFTSQLSLLKQLQPDVIYNPMRPDGAAMMYEQAHALGYDTFQMIGDDAVDAPETLMLGGEHVEGLLTTTHFHPDAGLTEQATKFVEAFRAKYNRNPSGIEAQSFDSYNMMLTAIENAGTADPEAVRDAIENLKDFPGATGPITMTPTHNPKKYTYMIRVENGEWAFVEALPPEDVPETVF